MSAVLISGAGIAGPTLAFWLKAAGFAPTLIERAPALRAGGYVIDFWGLGYDIAERMGLIGEINRIGYHVQDMRIVDDAGRRLAGFGTRVFSELTGGRYVTLQRSDLSRLLFESIKADTEALFDDEIVAIEQRPEHVRVELKHAGLRRYDYVVGPMACTRPCENLLSACSRSSRRILAIESPPSRPADIVHAMTMCI
jgi:2-polyprenyl-6-methoxyphenol hydroxylase-like FAD-dependent oxidoreductase